MLGFLFRCASISCFQVVSHSYFFRSSIYTMVSVSKVSMYSLCSLNILSSLFSLFGLHSLYSLYTVYSQSIQVNLAHLRVDFRAFFSLPHLNPHDPTWLQLARIKPFEQSNLKVGWDGINMGYILDRYYH